MLVLKIYFFFIFIFLNFLFPFLLYSLLNIFFSFFNYIFIKSKIYYCWIFSLIQTNRKFLFISQPQNAIFPFSFRVCQICSPKKPIFSYGLFLFRVFESEDRKITLSKLVLKLIHEKERLNQERKTYFKTNNKESHYNRQSLHPIPSPPKKKLIKLYNIRIICIEIDAY